MPQAVDTAELYVSIFHTLCAESNALAVISHVLQTALIEETDFKNEQFALVHPGGAVGERLNNSIT